jgi:hypothetical protein
MAPPRPIQNKMGNKNLSFLKIREMFLDWHLTVTTHRLLLPGHSSIHPLQLYAKNTHIHPSIHRVVGGVIHHSLIMIAQLSGPP